MRRPSPGTFTVLASVALIASSLTLAVPAATATPTKAAAAPGATLVGQPVQRTLFGMHVFNVQNGVWPTVPIGSLRLWDSGTKWAEVETAQNVFDWSKLDTAVATAQKNGVNDILMVLAGTPRWASSDPTNAKDPSCGGGMPVGACAPPTNITDWEDWVSQVVTRYKGRITSYQPWNEANLLTFWGGTPAQMADLTQRTYNIVKSIDPAAQVVSPSVGLRLGGGRARTQQLLKELKARNWPIDVFAGHSYPNGDQGPVERQALAKQWIGYLAAAGAPDLPLWDTENNLGFKGPGAAPGQSPAGKKAAAWTARLYLDALRLGISRVYWYAWIPNLSQVGLLGIQMYTGTPAAVAYSTLQDWIVGATYNGCGGGIKVTCNFTKSGTQTKIIYSQGAKQTVKVQKKFKQVCSLNGTCKAVPSSRVIKVSDPIQLKP